MHYAPRILIIALSVAALAAAPAGAAKSRDCGGVTFPFADGSLHPGLLSAVGTTCRTARTVATRWSSAAKKTPNPKARPLGYRCVRWSDGAGVDCHNGKRYISWGTH